MVINFIVICCPFFHSDRTSAGIVGVSPAHLTGEARSNNDIGPSSTHIPEVPFKIICIFAILNKIIPPQKGISP